MMNTFKVTRHESVNITDLSAGQRALGRFIDLPGQGFEDSDSSVLDLAGDAFWQYFLSDPRMVADDNLPASRRLNRALIEWAQQSPSWNANRVHTTARTVASAFSASMLAYQLANDPAIREALNKQREADEARAQADALERQLEQQRQQSQNNQQPGQPNAQPSGNDNQSGQDGQNGQSQQNGSASQSGGQSGQVGQGQLEHQIEALRKAAADAAASAVKQFEAYAGTSKAKAVRAASLKHADEEGQKVEAMIAAWGIDPGTVQPVNMDEVINLASEFTPSMQRLTAMMGRVKQTAINVKHRASKQQGMVIVDAGYTRRGENMFPTERARLTNSNEMVRLQALGEFADRGLLGMVVGSDAKEQGVLVVLVDESGSMAGMCSERARALALGIALAAQETGQRFVIHSFGVKENGTKTITDEADQKTLMGWATSNIFGGGTSFDFAFALAMDTIEGMGDDSERADVAIITDGICKLSPESITRYKEMRDLLGTRTVFVNVGGAAHSTALDVVADAVLDVDNMDDLDNVAENLSTALIRDGENDGGQ